MERAGGTARWALTPVRQIAATPASEKQHGLAGGTEGTMGIETLCCVGDVKQFSSGQFTAGTESGGEEVRT